MVLIAGAGRNTGKTTLACRIIQHFSGSNNVVGLKISPHFHELNERQKILMQTNEICIVEESLHHNKDSALMRKAGAKPAYYIQALPQKQKEALRWLVPKVQDKLIVCESGGLHQFVRPGVFVFAHRGSGVPAQKHSVLHYQPLIMNVFQNDSSDFLNRLVYTENQVVYTEKC